MIDKSSHIRLTSDEYIQMSEYSVKLFHPNLVRWLQDGWNLVYDPWVAHYGRVRVKATWCNLTSKTSAWFMYRSSTGGIILQCHGGPRRKLYAPEDAIRIADRIVACYSCLHTDNAKVVKFKHNFVHGKVIEDMIYYISRPLANSIVWSQE